MNFRSIYQHGFARVAACTGAHRDRRPAARTPRRSLRQARACAEEGVAVALFPELCLTGYSIEDLLLQDAVLDDVEAALDDGRRRLARTCCRCSSSARRCATATGSTTARSSSTAAGCSASRRSPTCRPTASSTSAGRSRPGDDRARRDPRRRRRRAVRPGPAVRRRGRRRPRGPRRGLRGHVGPGPAERRGGARRRDRAAQPLGQPDHRRPRRGPQAAVPVGSPRAAWPPTSTPPPGEGESTTDLSWDGQTMIYENGVLLAETDRFPDGDRRARSPTSTSTCCARSACGWGPSTTTAARTPSAPARFRRIAVHARPAGRRPRPAARGRALPVRPVRPRPPRARLLRGLQHPGRRACSSGCGRSATRRSSSASPAAWTRRTR